MIDENTLLHMSISIIPRHLFESLRSPFLQNWDALAFPPGIMICLAFKEVRNVFVDGSFWHIVHGFEGFGGDAVEAGCFSLLEFLDGMFDFTEGNRGVNVSKAWLLGNEFKDKLVDWSLVVEIFVEV